MIPPRLLALMVVAWLATRAVRGLVRYWWGRNRLPPSSGGARAAPSQAVGPTRACVHCGMFVPLEEGVTAPGGRFYCSAAHRVAARDNDP